MTEIGSTGSYKYDELSNRMTDEEAGIAAVTATIDGKTRPFSCPIARDA